MIPIKIQIKNFVSYGPQTQTIEFEPYHLLCLSGKNGHGKSALLDALTWVLWGQARKTGATAKPDEGLLRLGETSMMVSLDFKVGDQTYRVRREFGLAGKKNQAHLEFGIFEHEHVIRPLTDKTIKTTQEKIEKIIGLDYDTFINSAFLRQGQSNEFSKKTPKERKEILATILGLNEFETLKKLAAEKAREAQQQKEFNAQSIELLKRELENQQALDHQLLMVKQALDELIEKEAQIKTFQAEANVQLQALHEPKQKLDELNRKIEQLSAVIEQQTATIITDATQTRLLIKQKRLLPPIERIEQELAFAQKNLKHAHEIQQKKLSLKEIIFSYKERLTLLTQELEKNSRSTSEQLAHELTNAQMLYLSLEQHIKHDDQALSQLQKQIDQLMLSQSENSKKQQALTIPEHMTGLESQFDKRKEYYHKWVARIQFLKNEQRALEQKKKIIEKKESAQCPVCRQQLNPEHTAQIAQSFRQDEKRISHQIARLTQFTVALKELLLAQHKQLETYRVHIQQYTHLTTQFEEIHKQLQEIQKQHSISNDQKKSRLLEYQKAQEKVAACEKKIKDHTKSAQQIIDEHQERISLLSLIATHTTELESFEKESLPIELLTEQVKTLEQQKQEQAQSIAQIMLLGERKQRMSMNIKATKELKNARSETTRQSIELSWCIKKEREVILQLQELQDKMAHISLNKEKYILQKGSLDQQKLYYVQKEAALKDHLARIVQLDQSIEDYKAISVALSKDGIQALLIEDAIPEIESEANALLSKLTDNQAHLTIDSLRDTKSGTTKETLDIKISDAMGIRPYELFSGGEAFRIDFSLRIAISKLLAKRAGTSLQTLIIDEGFGSQDEEGLDHIMQALYKIQEDFSKIIVVSHLPSMKEQFPVHFQVTKGAHGSTIKIIHNG